MNNRCRVVLIFLTDYFEETTYCAVFFPLLNFRVLRIYGITYLSLFCSILLTVFFSTSYKLHLIVDFSLEFAVGKFPTIKLFFNKSAVYLNRLTTYGRITTNKRCNSLNNCCRNLPSLRGKAGNQ